MFQNFYHAIETQFHKQIAILQSDNGREFQNHNLSEFLASKRLVHQNSCAYTPQQNGVAERKNRHLLEVARSFMLSTSLPSYLWGDVILTAAHLINRMPSRILHLQTPLECLQESYPSTRLVSEVPLRVFGCTAYVHSFGPNQTKFTHRAQACVFVGYPPHQRGYKCFHPPPRKYFVTMDVTFFPWKTYYKRNLRKEVGSLTSQPPAPVQDSKPPRDQGIENPIEPCTNNTMNENDRSDVAILENVEQKNSGDETEVRTETSNNEAEQGHTGKLDKYDPSLDLPIALRKECPEWKNTVMEEMKALAKNNTWEICALSKGHKPVGYWSLYQLDVKNAFLNGDLAEEIYRSPPPGFEAQFGQEVCKLQKSLYGLKQSPRAWFDRFTTFVKSQGYSQGHSDHTLFTKVSETGKIAVLIVYVDDIVLSGDDQAEISQLKQRMGNEFEIKNLGNLKYFLGMELARSKEGISVSQRKYTIDLLTETGMLGCRPADTPIEFNCKLGNSDDQVPVDKEQYQRLVGKLIYLSHTRSDISFAGNLVTWRSKKQSVVARSSAEAEYRAMSLGICKEIWLQKVLSHLHQECETPLKLFCDNKAAISIANNPIQHDRTKHVEIDRHFIKEQLDSGSICIPYIRSSRQVADVLTKELLRPNFDFYVSKLGLIDIYVPT
ncbi:Cysteine-rich RLK (RECEPTOR-like protein kinase) 8 [Cucumis melo var. makuwa]|uniref:Cysteine-rich RLK (RECEPTOR-like protein kinase) 8 n=1 Tax=Cucumis melo var. makuwa TaxID=1194695 RepID=A0A5D3BUK5_CUCMM|nr:Cysteine-rich RLK (RECEPTOR-like protein kinase) 8 [Cucumis melo var. makuwa]